MLNHERPLETAMIRGEGRGFIPCSGGPSDSAYRNRLPVDRAPGGHRRDCSAKNSPAEYHDSHPPGAPGWRVRAKPGTCGPRGDVDHTRIVRRVRDRLVEWREWDEDKGCSLWGLGEKLAGRRTRPRRPQARRGDGQAHRQRTVPLGRALGHRRHPDALPCSRGPRGAGVIPKIGSAQPSRNQLVTTLQPGRSDGRRQLDREHPQRNLDPGSPPSPTARHTGSSWTASTPRTAQSSAALLRT